MSMKIKAVFYAASYGLSTLSPVQEQEAEQPQSTAQAQEENIIDTPIEAMHLLLPLEQALIVAQREMDQAKQTPETEDDEAAHKKLVAASEAIFAAQSKITELFGKGDEGKIIFVHNGRQLEAGIDCDKAMLRLTNRGFTLHATPAFVESIHASVMTGRSDINSAVEKQFSAVASSMYTPLSHEKAKAYYQHVFAGRGYKSTHNVDPQVIADALHRIATPALDKLNEDLKKALNPAP